MSKYCNSAFLTLGARRRNGYFFFFKCFRISWKVTLSRTMPDRQTDRWPFAFVQGGAFSCQVPPGFCNCSVPPLQPRSPPPVPRRQAPGSGKTVAEYQGRMCLLTRFSKCPTVKLGKKEGLGAFLERRPQWEQIKVSRP